MPELPCWYYEKKNLKNTPSFQSGIDPETEARYRREGARFIINTGTKMGLRYDTMATGVVYFHRYYMFHSFKEFPRYVMACCCLFLAGKVEETPKKCKHIVKAARSLLNDRQFAQFGLNPEEEVITLERVLLKTIKFDLQVQHPYSFLLSYGKQLKGDKEKLEKMIQMAWTFVNDSLCTTLCLQWEPEIIAIALMYLAGKLSKFEVVDWHGRISKQLRWWDMFVEDISMELLEDICHQVLDLYSNTPNSNVKPESPPATPPSQVPVVRPPILPIQQQVPKYYYEMMPQNPYHPFPFERDPYLQTPPPQPHAAIPIQVGKLKPDQPPPKVVANKIQPQTPHKKVRPNTQPAPPTDVIPPHPPLPPATIPPPQPPPYNYTAATNEHYSQYSTPPPMPPGYQQPQYNQGYAQPEQPVYEGDQRYNQPHYQGNYENSGYANYQPPPGQPYYSVPPPPGPPYMGQSYPEAYPTEYPNEFPPPAASGPPPPNAPYPPQPPGYPPPPNQNYSVPAPYPHRGGPPMGPHASPNPSGNVAPVRITGRARPNWQM